MSPGDTGGRRKDVLFAAGLLVAGVVGIGAAFFLISRDTPDGIVSVSTASGTEADDTDTAPADADADGLSDAEDPFALDPENGAALPVLLTFRSPVPGTILSSGFTGVMVDGTTPYTELVDTGRITVGEGALAVGGIGRGDAVGPQNDQRNALQLGIRVPERPFTIHARLVAPFQDTTPEAGQAIGVFVGTGDQDNYVRLAVLGSSKVELYGEDRGEADFTDVATLGISGLDILDLWLTIDPSAGTIQPRVGQTVDGETGAVATSLRRRDFPARWLDAGFLAVGIIAASGGASPLSATWGGVEIVPGRPAPPTTNGTTSTEDTTTTAEVDEVPDVLGQSEASARAELEAAGFEVSLAQAPSETVPVGLVSNQAPGPGIEAERGSTVHITISSGSAELLLVPVLIGVPEEEARFKLVGAGFVPRVVYRSIADEDRQGIVLNARPAAGSLAAVGSTVTIVVGREPPR